MPISSDHSFFCVGDTKQAIYGWRGGVAEIFDTVGQAIADIRQARDERELSQQPRSHGGGQRSLFSSAQPWQLLELRWRGHTLVDRLFHNIAPRVASLAATSVCRMVPSRTRNLRADQRQTVFLDFTARQIAELTSHSDASIGVLFRTNADVGRMISLLRELGVSASQDGGNPLSDSVAVELILSLLHLADHPGDGLCAFHVAASPLAEWLPYSSPRQPEKLAHWFRTLVARCGLGNAIAQVADHLADHLSWWDQHRLEQLIRAAHEFQPSYQGRLRDFEEAILRGRVALPTEAQVKVMTIHKSKGLEFDAVFLPDLDVDLSSSNNLFVLRGSDPCQAPDGVLRYMNARLQTLLPDDWQRAFKQEKERGINESLCLLYVAMTRARQALYMTARPTSGNPLQSLGSLLQSTLAGGRAMYRTRSRIVRIGYCHLVSYETIAAHQRFILCARRCTGVEQTTREESQIKLRTDASSAPVRGLRVAAPSSLVATHASIPLVRAFLDQPFGRDHPW